MPVSSGSPFGEEMAHSHLEFINLAPQTLGEQSQGINPDVHLANSHQTSAMHWWVLPNGVENADIRDVATAANIPTGA